MMSLRPGVSFAAALVALSFLVVSAIPADAHASENGPSCSAEPVAACSAGSDSGNASSFSFDPQAVIVELTAPPAARIAPAARALAGRTAAAQRNRVRRAMLDAENHGRQARGLGVAQAADVVLHEYRVVANGFAARLLPETIKSLAADPDVVRIVADTPVEATLDVSVPLVRAPEVWADFSYLGAGTTIAIIDTGVDYTHADLGGCFGPGCKVIGGYDFINNDSNPLDDNGHGTHVAATAAGEGALRGMAPEANILAYKVLNSGGSGASSTIIAGIERAVDPDNNGDPSDHVTVLNMSLGGSGDEDDLKSAAVDAATAAGVVSVISAGNNTAYFSIGSPGTARTALTVGASNDDDQIAAFSSRGPTLVEALLKPEITAPGVNICAARRPGSYAGRECIDNDHANLNGTSMAAPHVTGAVALLRGMMPSLSPAEAKAILMQSAVPIGLNLTTGGAGRLDVRAAFDAHSVMAPGSLNLGIDDGLTPTWSRTADVTVRNLEGVPKTYTLSFDDTGLPAGVSGSVSPTELSLPASGSDVVSVTIDVDNSQVPELQAPPYIYSGRVVAAAPGETLETLVSFARVDPIENDSCEGAIEVGAGKWGVTQLAVRATTDEDDPDSDCGCGTDNEKSLWYRVTPSKDGTVHITTFGSFYYPVVTVFAGSCNSLHERTCADTAIHNPNGSVSLLSTATSVSFAAQAGQSYYVEVTTYCELWADRLMMKLEVPGDAPPIIEALTEVFPTNAEIDIERTSLTFTPAGSSYSVCADYATSFPTDPAGGTEFDLFYDSVAAVPLTGGETVTLYGQSYGEFFINENGYVTFDAGGNAVRPTFEAHFGLPRISAFATDMSQYLAAGGNIISSKQLSDRLAVTWDRVYSFDEVTEGEFPRNSFQLEMFFDGRLRLTYLDIPAFRGMTGLSPGGGAPDLFRLSNFSAAPNCAAPAGGEVRLAGRKLLLRDSIIKPSKRVLRLVMREPTPATVPAPGSASDPTLNGAQLEVFNPQTSELETIALPAAGWTSALLTSGARIYRYRDRDQTLGPCKRVDLSVERGVSAQCKGGGLGFSLDELRQELLAATLTVGAPGVGTRFCGVFGGSVRTDRQGKFSATKAPMADRCLLPY